MFSWNIFFLFRIKQNSSATLSHPQEDITTSTSASSSFTPSAGMVNSMQQRSNLSQQQHQNSKSSSIQNCSSNNGLSSDTPNVAGGNAQTANQGIASVRNRACAENSNASPQKEIKGSSASVDVNSSHSSRDLKGRPMNKTLRGWFRYSILFIMVK